jgi:CheY-like chemotaxis protein/HPt (histidine-containing phosphotransfer) domain-containing protein
VIDTGVGIPADANGHLFEPFTQMDTSTTRLHGGSGLGLAISKQLVELMGGEIGVESVPQQGSMFWFTAHLDIATASRSDQLAIEPQSIAPHLAATNSTRLLVVDDSTINQQVALGLLAELGYEADAVGSGLEALETINQRPYAVVFMDCQMPAMDGFDATRQIRAQEPSGWRMPIVAMTADARTETRTRCFSAGMDEFISKPIRTRDLAMALQRWAPVPQRTSDGAIRGDDDEQSAEGVLDMVALETLQGFQRSGQKDLVSRCINAFLAAQPVLAVELRDHAARGDWEALSLVAHRVRGDALTVGATEVAHHCGLLEERSQQGPLTEADLHMRLASIGAAFARAGAAYEKLKSGVTRNGERVSTTPVT